MNTSPTDVASTPGPDRPVTAPEHPTRSVGDLVRAAVSGWLGTALE